MKSRIGLRNAAVFLFLCGIVSPLAGKEVSPVLNVKLPQPRLESPSSLEEVLQRRRSVRAYRAEPLVLADIAQLLWAAQGINSTDGRRTVPSAGARYPLEVYLVAGNVAGLSPAVYRYRPESHELMPITTGDQRLPLARAALGQASVAEAPAVIVVTAVYQRTMSKYRQRGIRYVQMEVGHAAQNVYLQATALGLGTVMIGAFDDEQVAEVLGLPEDQRPLALMPVGKRL
jgi:SagB-type dehydrogenase family enzyme